MTLRRMGVAVLALVVLVSACGSPDDRADDLARPEVTLAPAGTDRPAATPGGSDRGDPTTPGGAPAPGRTPAAPDDPGPTGPTDGAGLGDNAFLYLNDRVPRLIVEVDAVGGMAPESGAVDVLLQRLRSVVDKPKGITVLPAETIPGQADGRWSLEDVVASERRHRDHRSTPEAMVMYLQFLDGRFQQEPDAFGVAYSASSAAFFVDHMRDAATLLVGAEALQRATLVHEAGHLLALVNLGYESPRDHEDPQHPNHSRNERSVMFWAVDNVGVLTVLGGRTEPPTDFDADDRKDLADIAAGKLR